MNKPNWMIEVTRDGKYYWVTMYEGMLILTPNQHEAKLFYRSYIGVLIERLMSTYQDIDNVEAGPLAE